MIYGNVLKSEGRLYQKFDGALFKTYCPYRCREEAIQIASTCLDICSLCPLVMVNLIFNAKSRMSVCVYAG